MKKVETKEVNMILAGLSTYQRIYLSGKLSFSSQFREMVNHTKMSKSEVCNKWEITASNYDKLWNGTHPFDLDTISKLKCHYNDFLKTVLLKQSSETLNLIPQP